MNTPEDLDLAAHIETAIHAIPGVASVYRSGSVFSKMLEVGTRLLDASADDTPLVSVDRTGDTARVDVAISVHISESAVVTAQQAHNAARAVLEDRGLAEAEVCLTVVHVDESNM